MQQASEICRICRASRASRRLRLCVTRPAGWGSQCGGAEAEVTADDIRDKIDRDAGHGVRLRFVLRTRNAHLDNIPRPDVRPRRLA